MVLLTKYTTHLTWLYTGFWQAKYLMDSSCTQTVADINFFYKGSRNCVPAYKALNVLKHYLSQCSRLYHLWLILFMLFGNYNVCFCWGFSNFSYVMAAKYHST